MRKIYEIMTQDVQVLSLNNSIQEAAKRMKALDIGILPICDSGKLRGVITDRDITTRVAALGLHPKDIVVGDIMTSPVIYCYENEDIEDVARLMETKSIRRVVVLDQNKNLVGIMSIGDIAMKSREDIAGEIMEKIYSNKHQVAS